MKRMTLLVAVLLALLLPLSVLADAAPPAAPEALDMTAPLEAAEYQFDFLPWFTTFDDALAAFDLEAGDYTLTIAGTSSVVEPGNRSMLEFSYPSALTGNDARVQLIFELIPADADDTAYKLIGVRAIEGLADLDALNAYIDAVDARFSDMLEREVVNMVAKPILTNWPTVRDNFAADPSTASGYTISNAKAFTDPAGLDRNANMFISLNTAADTYALQMGSGSGEYFALYEFVLDSIQD